MAATAQVEADGRSGWWPRDGRGDGSATGGSEAAVTAAGGRTTTGGATKPTTARRPDPRRRRRCRVEDDADGDGSGREATDPVMGEKNGYVCCCFDSIYDLGLGLGGDAAPRSKTKLPGAAQRDEEGWRPDLEEPQP
jgi:hypothetical protein